MVYAGSVASRTYLYRSADEFGSTSARPLLRRRSPFSQLLKSDPSALTGLSADRSSAPVGVNPECGIPLVNHDGSIANIANIAACGLSMFFVLILMLGASRRKAAVGACPPARCDILMPAWRIVPYDSAV